MSARKLVVTILALLILGVVVMAMPWTRDMVAGPAVLPQERPMPPPPGVLSVGGEPIHRPQGRSRADDQSVGGAHRGCWSKASGCTRCIVMSVTALRVTATGPVGALYPNRLPLLDSALHPAVRRRVHVQHPSRGPVIGCLDTPTPSAGQSAGCSCTT